MFRELWTLLRRIIYVVVSLFALFFFAELVRVFLLLYRLNPVAGLAFAVLLLAVLLWAMVYGIVHWRRHPRVLTAPPLPDLDEATHPEMREYCSYLARYLGRLADNPNLDETRRAIAREKAADIAEVVGHHPLNDDLRRTIRKTEADVVGPLLADLGAKAEQEVRRSVRDVMLGVTLSPYPSVDLLIVLYRNLAMVTRVIGLYHSRPAAREELRILRDILLAVATVNFIHLNRKLIENLFAQIPVIGRFVDDIGQGLGAGMLTSVAGHAAVRRCTAFRGWNREEEARSLGARSADFLVDVRNLFTRELLPELKSRIAATVPPERAGEPGFWETISAGIGAAVDATARTLDAFILKPAVAGVQGVAAAGTSLARGVTRATTSAGRASARGGRAASQGAFRVLKTFGQRVKYTFIGHHVNK